MLAMRVAIPWWLLVLLVIALGMAALVAVAMLRRGRNDSQR